MILDLSSFTRTKLMVDHVSTAETCKGEGGGQSMHGKSRGRKTRNKVVEDRETIDLSAMGK